MGLFGKTDINQGLEEFKKTPGALLFDVRTRDEYFENHIPGAFNIPMDELKEINIPKETPIFLYCLRGTRSKRAEGILKKQGFVNAKSIGGITGYKGEK